MGDQPGANAKFAAPQDGGTAATEQYFDSSVLSAALERWVLNFGEQEGCATVPAQRSELSCA